MYEVITGNANEGIYSAHFRTQGIQQIEYAHCQKSLIAINEIYVRTYVKVIAHTMVQNNDKFYIDMLNAGATTIASAGWVLTSGVLHWTLGAKNGTATVTQQSIGSPVINQWYCVELYWKYGLADGTSRARLYIDGALVCELTNIDTTAYGGCTVWKVGLPTVANISSGAPFLSVEDVIDSCVAADTYIGPIGPPPAPKNLTINSNPELNVAVYVDNVLVGNSPITVQVAAGTHTVRVDSEVTR